MQLMQFDAGEGREEAHLVCVNPGKKDDGRLAGWRAAGEEVRIRRGKTLRVLCDHGMNCEMNRGVVR